MCIATGSLHVLRTVSPKGTYTILPGPSRWYIPSASVRLLSQVISRLHADIHDNIHDAEHSRLVANWAGGICKQFADLGNLGMALVAGDFNARTGFASGTCMEDFSDLLDTSLQPDGQLCVLCEHLKSRTSDDQHTCAFGKTLDLLDLCEMSDLSILNGRAPGETNGRMTSGRPAIQHKVRVSWTTF